MHPRGRCDSRGIGRWGIGLTAGDPRMRLKWRQTTLLLVGEVEVQTAIHLQFVLDHFVHVALESALQK